ncbi:MAG: hypothetical protein D6785_12355, partial [Planctomycetota bacterium]
MFPLSRGAPLNSVDELVKKLNCRFGWLLGEHQRDRLKGFIKERGKQLSFSKPEEYIHFLLKNPESEIQQKEWFFLIEALSVKKTEWFRYPASFEVLQEKILPEVLKEKKKISFWSAGCATGEEIYSLM